jgi:hypothetical protein
MDSIITATTLSAIHKCFIRGFYQYNGETVVKFSTIII